MSEHNFPRLFTPPILTQYSDELTMFDLNAIIKKQQTIIDAQGKLIIKHEADINSLHTSLQEIKHILNGRQFIKRGLSYESDEQHIEITD